MISFVQLVAAKYVINQSANKSVQMVMITIFLRVFNVSKNFNLGVKSIRLGSNYTESNVKNILQFA